MRQVVLVLLLIISVKSTAQNYKWIKGGGSVSDMGSSITEWDMVSHMCTDTNRNVYIVGFVGDNSITADTFYIAGAHYGGHGGKGLRHIFLASYNCEGRMRWGKLIEGDFFNQIYGLEYDGKSSVYLAGIARTGFFYSPTGLKYFGYDTIVNSGNLNMFLAKYDTSGKLRWLRFIGPDSVSTFNGTAYNKANDQTSVLRIDGQGIIHYYAHLMNNVRITPTVVSTTGNYDISYDSLGVITKAVRMQIDSAYYLGGYWDGAAVNKNSGTTYIFVDFVALSTSYIAAYRADGSQTWVDSVKNGSIRNLIYSDNSIYGAGFGYGYMVLAGDTIKTKIGGNINVIFKLDTLGKKKWIFELDADFSTELVKIALLPNGQIAAIGEIGDIILHKKDTLIVPPGDGESPFLVIIDTSGNKLYKLDNLHANGFYNAGIAITSDNANNIYLGGYVSDTIYANGISGYHNTGGESDFFIAKYGYNCNCTPATEPTPSYTYTGSGTVNFTYTGTVTPDSVKWSFGDGGTSTSINPTHNFHDTGSHHVCLTVYACDSGTYCDHIHTTVSVPIFAAKPIISVYPNPISGQFFIEGAELGTRVQILNIMGQVVLEGTITDKKQQLNTGELRLGTYLLQLIDKEGRKESMTIVKQ
jgi:hypothetical protein